MPGIIEGYNYDIFISYRQKDNLSAPGSGRQGRSVGWVSEFVEQALRDKIGLKVKLSNGNVLNRVLPVRIDLEMH